MVYSTSHKCSLQISSRFRPCSKYPSRIASHSLLRFPVIWESIPTAWWLKITPLKKIRLRQMGWCNSQLNGKTKDVPKHQPAYFLWLPLAANITFAISEDSRRRNTHEKQIRVISFHSFPGHDWNIWWFQHVPTQHHSKKAIGNQLFSQFLRAGQKQSLRRSKSTTWMKSPSSL